MKCAKACLVTWRGGKRGSVCEHQNHGGGTGDFAVLNLHIPINATEGSQIVSRTRGSGRSHSLSTIEKDYPRIGPEINAENYKWTVGFAP